jgi:general secretion pathway protein J
MNRSNDAGFTLIEVLVSLALFAMIAGAGLSVLDQILRTQSQTDGRLERLAGLQRMMHLVGRDLSEAAPGTVQGEAGTISLQKAAVTVSYMLADGQMQRAVAQNRRDATTQVILPGVTGLRWQFLDGDGAWRDAWPGSADPAKADLRAVAMTVSLPPGAGDLRRIVTVPRAGRP